MASRLVIGVGNRYRGDDAAGCLVADRLRACGGCGFDVVESDGDVAALLEWFRVYDEIIVVDAIAGAESLVRMDGKSHPLPATLSSPSSHGLGLAHAVEMARALGQLPRRLTVYGVPGRDFAPQEGVTAPTAQAVKQAAALIHGELLSGRADGAAAVTPTPRDAAAINAFPPMEHTPSRARGTAHPPPGRGWSHSAPSTPVIVPSPSERQR